MEPNQDNLTDQTLPGAAHVEASDGQTAVADTLSLAELNQHLGKDFKDTATALKAVKDTFSFVGKKVETPVAAASPDLSSKVQSLEEELFYTQNPDYKDFRDVIKATGKNPAEVVSDPAFKGLFEKAKVADEVQRTKSVVASNNRLGETKSVIDEAIRVANTTGSGEMTADVLAKGIREEMGF